MGELDSRSRFTLNMPNVTICQSSVKIYLTMFIRLIARRFNQSEKCKHSKSVTIFIQSALDVDLKILQTLE